MRDKTCPVCKFNEEEHNDDEKPWDLKYWISIREEFTYHADHSIEIVSLKMCPVCGVVLGDV